MGSKPSWAQNAGGAGTMSVGRSGGRNTAVWGTRGDTRLLRGLGS